MRTIKLKLTKIQSEQQAEKTESFFAICHVLEISSFSFVENLE